MKRNSEKDNIRQVNTATVLDALRRNDDKISRPDLAEQVGLSKVTIASIIRTLNQMGLTSNAGLGRPDQRGGRKPLLVSLDKENKRLISIRLGRQTAEMLLSDITGRELSRLRAALDENQAGPDHRSAKPTPEQLAAMVRQLSLQGGASMESLIGIMITGDEVVDSDDDGGPNEPVSRAAPEDRQSAGGRPDDTSVLTADLSRALNLPVRPVGLAKARAFGEHWFNDEYEQPLDFFYLNLDYRLDAEIYRGGQPGGSLPGFGALCLSHRPFGSENTIADTAESLLSGAAFLKKAEEKLGRPTSFSELLTLADNDEQTVLTLFEHYGYQLGCTLALAVNLSSLTRIIVGGAMSGGWPFFSRALFQGLDRHLHQRYQGQVSVSLLRKDLEDGLMGALALALDKWIYHTSLLPRD